MRVGAVEITPLLDSVGSLGELSENYPDVPATEWAPYAEQCAESDPASRAASWNQSTEPIG